MLAVAETVGCKPHEMGGLMTRLSQADLVSDLDRQQGKLLEQTVLELLSRGKTGVRSVAAKAPDERISRALAVRGRQVIELLHKAESLADDVGAQILEMLHSADIVSKMNEFWSRGDAEGAFALFGALTPEHQNDSGVLLFRARVHDSEHNWNEAREFYGKALAAGAGQDVLREALERCMSRDDLGTVLSISAALDKDRLSEVLHVLAHAVAVMLCRGEQSNLEKAADLVIFVQPDLAATLLYEVMAALGGLLRERVHALKTELESFCQAALDIEEISRDLASDMVALDTLAKEAGEHACAAERRAREVKRSLKQDALAAPVSVSSIPLGEVLLDATSGVEIIRPLLIGITREEVWQSLVYAHETLVTRMIREPRADLVHDLCSIEQVFGEICDGKHGSRAAFGQKLGERARRILTLLDDVALRMQMAGEPAYEYARLDDVFGEAADAAAAVAAKAGVALAVHVDDNLPRVRVWKQTVGLALANLAVAVVRSCAQNEQASLTARLSEGGSTVELRFECQAQDVLLSSGRNRIEQVMEQHGWTLHIESGGRRAFAAVRFPRNLEEGMLSAQLAGYASLSEQAKQALRAAEALYEQNTDPETCAFLYGKAVEMETAHRLLVHLERHRVLAKALQFRDSQKQALAAKRLLECLGAQEKDLRVRMETVVGAAVKDKLARQLSDFRNVAVSLCVFEAPVPVALVSALYAFGERLAASTVALRETRDQAIELLRLLSAHERLH